MLRTTLEKAIREYSQNTGEIVTLATLTLQRASGTPVEVLEIKLSDGRVGEAKRVTSSDAA